MNEPFYKVSSTIQRFDVFRATNNRTAARKELDLVKIGQRATGVTAESIERAIAAGRAKS